MNRESMKSMEVGEVRLESPGEVAQLYLKPGTLVRLTRISHTHFQYEEVEPSTAQGDLGI